MYALERALIWPNVFEFPGGLGESLVWRAYAPTDDEVHALGCERERNVRQRKPDMRYAGFITAVTGSIRRIRTAAGHGFAVEHKPEEGDHHAEIRYAIAPGVTTLSKSAKADLKVTLREAFGPLVSHTCPDLTGASGATASAGP